MPELRPYQQAAVEAVYKHLREKDSNPCVVLPTGTGKSLVIGKIASDAVKLWNGRVLILAHVKELLEQNADKVRKLCPELPIGIYSAGLKSRQTSEPVIVAGIQSVYNKACDLGAFDLVIVDECFTAGTMIDTPRGLLPIEELYVGQPVRHAMGVGKIEAISSRPAKELIQLELSNGRTIKCTPNHLFFTECGWRPAGSLAVGTRLYSRKDVSSLWEGVSTEYLVQCGRASQKMSIRTGMDEEEVLFQSMPKPGTTQAEGSQAAQCLVEAGGADSNQKVSMLRKGDSSGILQGGTRVSQNMGKNAFLLNLLCKESGQSNVSSWHCGESVQEFEGNQTFSETARRERERTYQVAEGTGGSTECTNRISSPDNTGSKRNGRVTLLQAGCGDSIYAACISIGRKFACDKEDKGGRPEHEALAGGIRVVGVAHIKLESPCTVYNLQVEGHPSYFADGVLVHNCHLIAPEGDGMYRTFLNDAKVVNPNVRLIGMTATPFRLKGGLICKPENLLNEVCYEAGLKEMIAQGYLSPIISRAGKTEARLDDLHIRGGEFINDEVAAAMDKEELVRSSCREIAELTKDRKSVIIFCTSIEHCQHVAEKIRDYTGQECAVITGDTPAHERAELIARFRGEKIPSDLWGNVKPPLKYLCNVAVLTTGFDAPNVDCVVMLRPTNSPGLLLQIAGRGLRLSPDTGKENCLFLDYGGNILRHGPLDMIRIQDKTPGQGGEAPAKKCPQCNALIHAGYSKCPECGYEFPPPERTNLTEHASTAGVLSGEVINTDYQVQRTFYEIHQKRNAEPGTPATMRIDYDIGYNRYKSEWVCPEHTGYARQKFLKWWKDRAPEGCPIPDTAEEAVALARANYLTPVTGISVRYVTGEKFERITAYKFGEKAWELPPDDWKELFVPSLRPTESAIPDDGEEPPF